MADAPPLADIDLSTTVVRIEGKTVSNTFQIVRLETVKEVNRIAHATVTFLDGDVAKQTFELSEAETFIPGKAIEIDIGYHGKTKLVFKGIIVKQGVVVTKGRECRLIVTCSDKAVAMTVSRHKALFPGKTDAIVLTEMIKSYKLKADLGTLGKSHKQMVQYFATDWDYLLCRAEANGAIVIVDDGTVSVKAPAFSDPEEKFGFGTTLIDIDIEMDARFQLASSSAQAWDPSTQGVLTQKGTEPSFTEQGNLSGKTLASVLGAGDCNLQTAGALTEDDLKSWADARLLKSRLSRIRGRAVFIGNAGLKPGQLVELNGLGARFNGSAFISRVRHMVEAGVWKTEVGFGLPHRWFGETPDLVGAAPAASLVPSANGLQIGKVKKIYEDPDGERRVKVSLPLLEAKAGGGEEGAEGEAEGGEALEGMGAEGAEDEEEDGIWMRLAGGYATTDAGFYFMPEIDDEVVVGFLNGDPAAPIVLGSLQSSQRKAPYVPEETNATKAIVTKGLLKLVFDDVKKSVMVQTPGGHSVLISDETKSITIKDITGNQMVMDEKGVALSSPGDVTIKATGSIKLTGESGVSISSPANVDISGQNTTVKADMALSAQGQAQAELKSAAGEVTIQGLMVMIN